MNVSEVVRTRAAVLPEQVARDRVERLDDVARIRHVHDAVVNERRALLAPARQAPRPDHAQLAHVPAVDGVERAVAPAVERPAPHQPVGRVGVLEHRVRDGDEVAARLSLGARQAPPRLAARWPRRQAHSVTAGVVGACRHSSLGGEQSTAKQTIGAGGSQEPRNATRRRAAPRRSTPVLYGDFRPRSASRMLSMRVLTGRRSAPSGRGGHPSTLRRTPSTSRRTLSDHPPHADQDAHAVSTVAITSGLIRPS